MKIVIVIKKVSRTKARKLRGKEDILGIGFRDRQHGKSDQGNILKPDSRLALYR